MLPWFKFAITRQNDAFVAKLIYTRLTKTLWPFLPSPKGCPLLPPWSISRNRKTFHLKKFAAYKVSALIQCWARVSLFLTPGLGDYPSSPSLDLQLSPHPHHHQDQQSSSLLASSPVKIGNQPLEIKVGHVCEPPTHPSQSIKEHWQLFQNHCILMNIFTFFKIIASRWIYSLLSEEGFHFLQPAQWTAPVVKTIFPCFPDLRVIAFWHPFNLFFVHFIVRKLIV